MLTVTIPDNLTSRIFEYAEGARRTPEEFVIEVIRERLEHDSAYRETVWLARSETNRKRLDRAVKDIQSGKFESHALIEDE